jgi:hypothetical protein
MERIFLPRGAWADLRPGVEIPERYMRQVRARLGPLIPTIHAISRAREQAIRAAQAGDLAAVEAAEAEQARLLGVLGDDGLRRSEEANDWAICGCVAGWSLDAPCPPTLDTVQDLPSDIYARLRKEASDRSLEAMLDLSPHAEDLRAGKEPDRGLPFGSSNGSGTPSPAPSSPTSSESPGPSGAPTSATSGSAGLESS